MNAGRPALIWTWTSTSLTSMPENATVRSRATPSAEVLRVFIAMVERRPGKVSRVRGHPGMTRRAGKAENLS